MNNSPIRRSEYLVPLSRDHHTGLLFCWKLRTGIKKAISPKRLLGYILYYWDHHLEQHFEKEETLLCRPMETRPTLKALEQHAAIRARIAKVSAQTNKDLDDFITLEGLINQHIRFEERELFPFLELAFSGEQLAEIAQALEELDHGPFRDDYADEFWL
jgi:hemerythrin-like domain-containing protein